MSGQMIHGDQIHADTFIDCDVVVVGSGSGGGAAAARLAEGGLDVVVLEEGGYYDKRDYTRKMGEMLPKLYRESGSSIMLGTPAIMYQEGRCVGGSTVMNGGMCWDTPEKIMQRWRWEAGLDFMNQKEMEPYFGWVNKAINAAPQHPDSLSRAEHVFFDSARSLGMSVTPNRRNQVKCMGSNVCILGCPGDRKRAVHVTYIPRAMKKGARVHTDCKVRKILTQRGTAYGVVADVLDRQSMKKRHKLTVNAKVVYLACGAIQTPALLQKNRLCNSSKMLGKNYLCHPNIKMVGVFPDPVYYWKGVHQGHQIHHYLDEGFIMTFSGVTPSVIGLSLKEFGRDNLKMMERFNHMIVAGALIEDTTTGWVKAVPGTDIVLPYYQIDRVEIHRMKRAASLLAQIHFNAGAEMVITPFANLPELHSMEDVKKIYSANIKPSDIESMTVHMMGTAVMGNDPKRHVVQPTGETWDVKNLFVGDASLFPTGLGVNPQVTIQALAAHSADAILENQKQYLTQQAV